MKHNFGYLTDIIKNEIAENYNNTKAYKLLNEYIELLNNNETLKEQYFFYNNLKQIKTNKENTKDYIKNNFNLMFETCTPEKIQEANKKLAQFVNSRVKNKYNIENSLYENIDFILTNKKTLKNINLIENRIALIEDFINENCGAVKTENEDIDLEMPELNEEEGDLLNKIITMEPEKRNTVLDALKQECLVKTNVLIKEAEDIDIKEKLLEVKERILNETFNENTFINDYVSLYILKENL